MTIRFLCPSGHSLSVPDDWAGRMVRCAACKGTVYVPECSEGKPWGKAAASGAPPLPSALPVSEPIPWHGDEDSHQGPVSGQPESAEGLRPDAPESAHGPEKRPVPPPLPPQQPATQSPPPEPTAAHARPSPTRRLRSHGQPSRMPPGVYRPDAGNVATVKWLALILGLVVAFSITPVLYLAHFNPATAPDWAHLVLAVAVVQAAYIAWMLNVPDWATVWVVMLVFAAVSALYAVATAVAVATPLEEPIWLDMGEVRNSAGAWCGAVLLAMSLATYLCGRTATKWRRTFELQTARRGKAEGVRG